MRLRKGLLQFGLILAFPFLVGALCLNSLFAVNQSAWNNKHISNYTMTVTVLWFPVPASDVQVIVQNGNVTDEKLLECEVGQPEYSPSTCETLTTYYYSPGGDRTYTIDDLFEIAQTCTQATNAVVERFDLAYLAYQLGFTGFTSSDAMYDFERANWDSLTSSDHLCSVEYNAQYGYPEEIALLTPQVTDGGRVIVVKNFHADDIAADDLGYEK